MDGYALASARARGASEAPLSLPVLGTIYAGDPPHCQVESGAWKIMTGAPIPAGCDTVVPVEQTKSLDGGRAVEILVTPHEGDFIRKLGHDFSAGAQVCPAGTVLAPKHLMALAAVGVSQVKVRRKPKLALISTGKELVSPDQPLKPGQIRDASASFIAAECHRLGWELDFEGIIPDDSDAFYARVDRLASKDYDAILTTGAVSMGDADFIPKVLKELGARQIFHKTAIKPGRPILFAEFEKGPFVFGLPGNPVSSVVGMRFFVQPFFRELMGQPAEKPAVWRLDRKTDKSDGLRCFFKARRREEGLVEILPAQASFQIHSMLAADCWAVLPEKGAELKAGTEVEVYEA